LAARVPGVDSPVAANARLNYGCGVIRLLRQIIDGVFELLLGFVNVHLAVIDDGVVLIDTGLPGRRAALRIESALNDVHRTVR
jgi:hypothetical protein